MRPIFLTLSSLLAVLMPLTVQAHPGHGSLSGHELAHYLTSPAHVGPLLLILALGAFFFYRRQKSKT